MLDWFYSDGGLWFTAGLAALAVIELNFRWAKGAKSKLGKVFYVVGMAAWLIIAIKFLVRAF